MTDRDQAPYADGWYDCLAYIQDLIEELQENGFDQATLDEMKKRVDNE
jgi:predicted metal-dependent phosphotriesterase family hydrolase